MTSGQIVVAVICLFILAGWGIWRLYRHTTRVRRRLGILLESLEAGDTSLRFPETPDKEVNGILNRISGCLADMKRKAVESDRFHEAILTDVATGVMVYDSRGYVVTHNPAMLALVNRPAIANVGSLRSSDERLADFLLGAYPGSSIQLGNVAVKVTTFSRHDGEELRIAIFDDISSPLEGKSVEAWVDMSRVLTHEIMNGIAPVLSVADSLRMRYKGDEEYMRAGLRAISESSEGLKRFVERYNMITRVAVPEPGVFDIVPLLEDCIGMLGTDRLVITRFKVPVEGMSVYADRGQIQQVVVNLLKNAMETDAGEIKVSCCAAQPGYVTVVVEDDGTPIPPEISERIFTPFFTTKPSGSGIGLSLSRRIVNINGGTLTLASGGTATRFVMTLPDGGSRRHNQQSDPDLRGSVGEMLNISKFKSV